MGALKTLLQKYSEQIPEYESLQDELGLKKAMDSDAIERTGKLVELLKDIEKFDEPAKKSRFNDKKFAESLVKQFGSKGMLSEKQVNAMVRLITKYKDQVNDFENRSKGLELEAKKAEAEVTDVTCPQCNDAKLVKRQSRGRTFYGCGSFPKCKYITPSLDNLETS